MSQQPALITGDQSARASTLDCYLTHNGPDPFSASCELWACRHFLPKSSGFEMSVRVVCTGWQTGSVGSVL